MRYVLLLLVFVVFAFSVAFTSAYKTDRIYVTIPPLKSIVQRVLPNPVVTSLIPQGVDPHHFLVPMSTLKSLKDNSIIISLTGEIDIEQRLLSPIASWHKHIKIIPSAQGIALIDNDPHIWLSVRNLKKIASNIARSFGLKPDLELIEQLDTIDREFIKIFKELKVVRFLCLHPAWKYFARDYNLEMVFILDYTGGVSPSKLKKLLDRCRKGEFKFVFVEKGFNDKLIESFLKETKIAVIKVNPLSEDIVEEFKSIAEQLKDIQR